MTNDKLLPNGSRTTTRMMILCALFSALIAVGAFIRVPIPVVPFTLQTLFTNLAGILLGKRWGAASAALYMGLGLLGLPVFTGGGGFSYIFQPTFGYILGFIGGAFLAGYIVERCKTRSFKTLFFAGLAHLSVVYGIGMIYYYCIANYYLQSPMSVGALIFYCFLMTIPGDLVLCALAAMLGKRLLPLIQKL